MRKEILDFLSILLIAVLFNSTIAFAETGAAENKTPESQSSLPAETLQSQDSSNFILSLADSALEQKLALADAENAAADEGSAPSAEQPEVTTTEKVTQFACMNPSTNPDETVLAPKEVDALKKAIQNLETQGALPFTGKEITTPEADKSTLPLKDREKLENSQIIIPTGVGKDAILSNMPNSKFSPGEAPILNLKGNGPFAIGISLDDTLRVGRCEDIATQIDQNSCTMTDKRMQLRNSGEGITQDFKNVFSDLGDWVGFGENMNEQLGDSQTQAIQTALASEPDPSQTTYKQIGRLPGNLIKNSIKTQSFSASIGSNCNSNDCLISTYSAFDKYFNSWYSADLVISNFGPTLFGQAKRYLGNLGRRGWPWDMSNNAFLKQFRKKSFSPSSLLGKARIKSMNTRIDKYGFGEYRKLFWEGAGWQDGYAAVKGGGTRKLLDDWTKAGGKLESEIKDPVRRGEFFKLVNDWRGVAQAHSALAEDAFQRYDSVVKQFGINSLEGRAARIEYAQTSAKLMSELDNLVKLDFPEFWAHDSSVGLYNKAIRNSATGQYIKISEDSSNISAVMDKFSNEANWADWEAYAARKGSPEHVFDATEEGFLKIWEPNPAGRLIDTVSPEDLQKHFTIFQGRMVKLEDGTFIPLDTANIELILKEAAPSGKIQVYELGWKEADPLTPDDFAARYTQYRVRNRLVNQLRNHTDRLYNSLIEKGWAGQNRTYLSLIDKAMSQEEDILKSYFSIKGGAKWTIVPYVYWGLKRGAGQPNWSGYQLPDTWRTTALSLGETDLYNDSFIDFFANEGSDEGDLFAQALNVLPWKLILNKIADNYTPVKNTFDSWTGRGTAGFRSKVENIAAFSNTGSECGTCDWTFNGIGINPQTGAGDSTLGFSTHEGLSSMLLEDTLTDDAKEKGSTIIAYAHHTNLDFTQGADADATNTKIDLVQDKKDGKTCQQVLDKIPVLGFVGKVFNGKPSRVGAALAFGESMGYAVFGWAGIFGSVAQQTLIAPEFKDCTDDIEGYYIHLSAPSAKAKEKTSSPQQIANEKAPGLVKNVTDAVLGPAKTGDQPKNFLDTATDKIREEVQAVSGNASNSSIVQANVESKNFTSGLYFGKKLFFFWYKGELNVSKYDTETKTLVKDEDSKIDVLIDKQAGQISVNGNPVITNPDLTRLTAPNGNIAAEEIPQRITKIILPSDPSVASEILMQMNIKSDMLIADTATARLVFDCIRTGIKDQSGVAWNSNNLSDAFGKVKSIASDTHPNIIADELSKTITAEGTPREIVYGDNAVASIKADAAVELSGDKGNAKVGKLQSVQFANGVIVYNPAKNELLIWLKHNEKSILNQNDVEGLLASPDSYSNPDTGCPEPAINLEAIPKAGSDAIANRVENFNDSMQIQGPFQTFDTDTHRYIFYSKLVGGECKNFFKSIDKKTGEVYDQEITGPLQKTPTGVQFTTADGKTHSLDFSAPNGVPTVSYNGQPAEVLKSASGPNGSFWYDPASGNWYPENAQLIPLDAGFQQKGFSSMVGPDGKVSQVPGGNPLTVNVGAGTGLPFNLPSLPEGIAMLLFFALLLCTIIFARAKIEKISKKQP